MTLEQTMREKLTKAFTPQKLVIENQSQQHDSHPNSPHTGESHFFVEMTSQKFKDMGRLERMRAVYGVLDEELKGPIHALSLKLKV